MLLTCLYSHLVKARELRLTDYTAEFKLEVVRLQIIVMYLLVGAMTFTALAAAFLSCREFFNAAHQFVFKS